MSLEFVPRRQLRDHLLAGWHLIPGMDYAPAEWAFLMDEPGLIPLPAEVAAIMRPYQARDARRSNRSQGRCRRYSKIAP